VVKTVDVASVFLNAVKVNRAAHKAARRGEHAGAQQLWEQKIALICLIALHEGGSHLAAYYDQRRHLVEVRRRKGKKKLHLPEGPLRRYVENNGFDPFERAKIVELLIETPREKFREHRSK
jgi:hypothetical protein